MLAKPLWCLLAASVLTSACHGDELRTATPADVGLSAQKLAQVGEVLKTAIDKNQTAGAVVLVARHGKVAFLESAGFMDKESSKAMKPDTIFRIFSMTKPITSVGALMLVERHKLSLEDPVSKYLPELANVRVYSPTDPNGVPTTRQITIRDLMRHTSGLMYVMGTGTAVEKKYIDAGVEDASDTQDLVTRLSKMPLQAQPGTQFNYSFSTDVLGRVIEVISGQRLDQYLQDHILKPLDMKDTGFMVPKSELGRFATSYWVQNGSIKANEVTATSPYAKPRKFLSGGGGLVSTARDYARFCQMLLNGGKLGRVKLLEPETIRQMTTNQLPTVALPMSLGGFKIPGLGFGLGVSVQMPFKVSDPSPAVGEFGWSGAASTFFWVVPKLDMFVIVLQQVEPLNIGLQLSLKPTIYGAVERS